MPNILQFKICLTRIEPKIWRRFLVIDDISFFELHLIIQNVMGWTNSHLYMFIYNKNSFIGNPELMEDDKMVDAEDIHLNEFFTEPKTKINYEYDMGDGWMHELILEKISEKEPKKYYPVCISGENNCPPEDCGGVGGFENFVSVMKKKKGNQYKMLKQWHGGDYNPDEFDLETINENLKNHWDIDMKLF